MGRYDMPSARVCARTGLKRKLPSGKSYGKAGRAELTKTSRRATSIFAHSTRGTEMSKRKTRGKAKPNQDGSSAEINIRMYRVGFGDCFLLTLAGQYHILVDCGVHSKGNITVDGQSLIEKAFH